MRSSPPTSPAFRAFSSAVSTATQMGVLLSTTVLNAISHRQHRRTYDHADRRPDGNADRRSEHNDLRLLLSSTQLGGLTTPQVGGLSTTDLTAITVSQLSGLTSTQIQEPHLDSTECPPGRRYRRSDGGATQRCDAGPADRPKRHRLCRLDLHAARRPDDHTSAWPEHDRPRDLGHVAAEWRDLDPSWASLAEQPSSTRCPLITDVASLSSVQLSGLTSTQMGLVSTTLLNAITTANIAGLTTTQIGGLMVAAQLRAA